MLYSSTGKVRLLIHTLLLSMVLATAETSLAQTAPAAPPVLQELQVNINEADAATIADVLVGIGASRARAIVEYREEHGRFNSLEDLTLVNGVGEATVENNRERIRFE